MFHSLKIIYITIKTPAHPSASFSNTKVHITLESRYLYSSLGNCKEACRGSGRFWHWSEGPDGYGDVLGNRRSWGDTSWTYVVLDCQVNSYSHKLSQVTQFRNHSAFMPGKNRKRSLAFSELLAFGWLTWFNPLYRLHSNSVEFRTLWYSESVLGLQ